MLQKQGFGASFKLAISGKEIHLVVGYAFVDDSNIIQTAVIRDTDIDKVFKQAQEGLNTFVGGMKATGGQVRPNKWNYYKIEFVWRNDKWKYAKKNPGNRELYIQETPTKRTTHRKLQKCSVSGSHQIGITRRLSNK
jgi:hypothetical protein